MLPNTIKNKINSMINHAKKSNEFHNQILLWFKNKGYDVEFDGQDQILADIIIDGITQYYNSQSTIDNLENYLIDHKKVILNNKTNS